MLRVVLIAMFAGFVGAGLQTLVFGYFGLATSDKEGSQATSHADVDAGSGPSSSSSDAPAFLSDNQTAPQQAEELTAQLRQQQIAQLELQRNMDEVTDTVALLREKLDALDTPAEAEVAAASDFPDQDESAAVTDVGSEDGTGALSSTAPTRQRRLQQFATAGIDTGTAEQLLTRLDQQQLAELELRDEAARGGWLDSPEFEERQQELETSAPDLQSELGDDGYDRYLFAAGRANRVRVGSVITGSAAQQADVRQGDLIIGYAGQQIFRIDALQAATRDGVRGEFVDLVLLRGQETVSQSVERGPLGVSLSPDRQDPDESPRP